METEEIKYKMHHGAIYYENGEIYEEQRKYHRLLFQFNQLGPDDFEQKEVLLNELLGQKGKDVYIEPPLRANWGANTYFGDRVYANFNLTLVDDTKIEIGEDCMIGPNVTIVTASHPLDPALRLKKAQVNLPVIIEKNVWLGAGVTVFPGVTIGENSVIGAGSLVTKDIPANVLAFGSPCIVQRSI